MLRALCVLSWCAAVAVGPRAAAAAWTPGPAGAGRADAGSVAADGPPPASAATQGPTPAATGEAVALGSRAPAVEVSTAKRVCHDGYFGFGFGLGGGNLRSTDGAKGASAAATLLVRGGGRWTDRVALGALVVTSFGGVKGGGVTGFSNLAFEALFFPVQGRGLGLAAALGLSSAWVREVDATGTRTARSTRLGGGFGVGVGYDFWLARRFNLGVWLRGDGSAGGYGLRAAGTLMLSFSWF